jgi:hypothetical protein
MAARNPEDGFERQQNVDSPARYAFAITASESPLEHSTRGIYIGGAGNITVVMTGFANNVTSPHASVTFTGLVAGTILPIRADKVTAASASMNLIGLY